jgi:DNA-binding transcriptional ArsR family regulator
LNNPKTYINEPKPRRVEAAVRAIKVMRDPKAMDLLADPTRRKIIDLLRAKEMAVIQIAEHLDKTPQAIYHHIRKMLETGLIEVAKEERIDHFIETYYRATAEFFMFTQGEQRDEEGGRLQEARTREAVLALPRLGLGTEIDSETVAKVVGLARRMEQAWKGKLAQEVSEKVAEMEDLDYFTKQFVIEYAQVVSMNDKQFEEMQRHQRELRESLVAGLKRKPELPVKQRAS